MTYYNENNPKTAAWLRELIKLKLISAGEVDERSIADVQPNDLVGYTRCHFFAGLGGWDYALQLAGWPIDRPIWTGSCPCQPYSAAGKQLGDADERNLWPEYRRLIRKCRPDVCTGEQVASAIGHGWLDGISTDLEAEGYAVGTVVLGAHSVGAPHQRQRLYWLAQSERDARESGRLADGPGGGAAAASERTSTELGQCGVPDGVGNAQGDDQLRNTACEMQGEQQSVGGSGGDGRIGYSDAVIWKKVTYACECDEDGNCPNCGIDFAECNCIGPTQDGIEYAEFDGVLYGRMGEPIQSGLQGHAGNVHDRHEPGRQCETADRPASETSRAGAWSDFYTVACLDGKTRRIGTGIQPLVAGLPRGMVYSSDPSGPADPKTAEGRVMRLRGYGNSIVPQVAAEFIKAWREVCHSPRPDRKRVF